MAFAAAAEGHLTEIAVEVYPTVQYQTAQSKVSRSLLPDGDMNPAWQLEDEILAVNGERVLQVLSEGLGFEPPRRRVVDVGAAIAGLSAQLGEIAREVKVLGQQQRQLAMVRRTPVGDAQRKARA